MLLRCAYFYYESGNNWGPYGFADEVLVYITTGGVKLKPAIDHGPIVTMIENYWTGLFGNCLRKIPIYKKTD